MYTVQNLGLNMPGQEKVQGYFNSVGTSLGFGKRHEPLDGQPIYTPGVGSYNIDHNIAKDAGKNADAQWR